MDVITPENHLNTTKKNLIMFLQ